jgi:hypothetical protein
MDARELTRGASFCALGILTPIVFHMMGLGKIFLPMHIPVLVAGAVLTFPVGISVALLTPFLSMLLTGMPPLPYAILMCFELMALSGAAFIFTRMHIPIIIALACAIIIRCAVTWIITFQFSRLLGLPPHIAGWTSIISGSPGIVLQLIIAPAAILSIRSRTAFSRSN